MIAKAFYNNQEIGILEGENVKDLIEENFEIFKSTIRSNAGNDAGFELEKAWIIRIDSNICEFHVIAHGDDNLIRYDPIKDTMKQVVFQITGIPKEIFQDTYEFEITDRQKFNPFNTKNYTELSAVVGILEGCVDYLVRAAYPISTRMEIPSRIVFQAYPTLKNNNPALYVAQLMLRFNNITVSTTAKNQDIFELIKDLNDILIPMLTDDAKINGVELLYYHKTMYYFQRRNKITALKYYRKKSGKTQTEVAEAVGIGVRQYQRYEAIDSSLGDARGAVVDKIAETIGIDTKKIIKYGQAVLIEQ